jgi:predicted DNA repair protein MutK
MPAMHNAGSPLSWKTHCMAGASLFTLLDDIATLLDDVAVMTKVAAKKTAGVLGDDLALNAQQVTGVKADRELPVVWGVAKGSLVNKAILVPGALAISVWLPVAIPYLMMIGGAYLCFEGVEKLAHKFLHSKEEDEARHAQQLQVLADESVDVVAFEKDKIKGAIRTDFILSAEIIVLSLGVFGADTPFTQKLIVLVAIALAMTVGVYGLVGAIVKLDDLGLVLTRKGAGLALIGRGLLQAAPLLMKFLSIAGTIAMFLVGGGILVHNIGPLHHFIEGVLPQGMVGTIVSGLFNAVVGMAAGALVLGAVTLVKKLRGTPAAH